MSINYAIFACVPRILFEVPLAPRQGHTIQPTGFPGLPGGARYTLPDVLDENGKLVSKGVEMLLVESYQSVANHMEACCWDDGQGQLHQKLAGLPYVEINCGDYGVTNTIKEFHRLNSPYIWEGDSDENGTKFRADLRKAIGVRTTPKPKKGADEDEGEDVPGILDMRKLARAVFKYDPCSIIHGLFLEKIAGRLRLPRSLSGFIEGYNVRPAESGGVKIDHVLPSPKVAGLDAKKGFGNVPYPRVRFACQKITGYFNVDLAQLRGYGLPDDATRLLIALSLFKIRSFLNNRLDLRAECDLVVKGAADRDAAVQATMPTNEPLPTETDLVDECGRLMKAIEGRDAECQDEESRLFARPAVTRITWGNPQVVVLLPDDTAELTIPPSVKKAVTYKKRSAKKPATLTFKKGIRLELIDAICKANESYPKLRELIEAPQVSGQSGAKPQKTDPQPEHSG